MVNMLAQLSWPQWMLAALIIVVCLLLMIVILLQRGRGGGLSGAFGGGGGSAAFGAKTGDVFTWITVGFTTVFVLLTVVANFAFDESARPAPPADTTKAPSDEPGGGATDDSGVKPIELGGEPGKMGEGSEGLPMKVTPLPSAGETAPTATGTPTLPERTGDSAAEPDEPGGSESTGGGADDDADGSHG